MKREPKSLNLNLFFGTLIAIGLGGLFFINRNPKPFVSKAVFILDKDFEEQIKKYTSEGWNFYSESTDTTEAGIGKNYYLYKN